MSDQGGTMAEQEPAAVEVIDDTDPAVGLDDVVSLAAAVESREAPRHEPVFNARDKAFLNSLGNGLSLCVAATILRVAAALLIVFGAFLLAFQALQIPLGQPMKFHYTLTENGVSREIPLPPLWGNLILVGIVGMIWMAAFVLTRVALALRIVRRLLTAAQKQ